MSIDPKLPLYQKCEALCAKHPRLADDLRQIRNKAAVDAERGDLFAEKIGIQAMEDLVEGLSIRDVTAIYYG